MHFELCTFERFRYYFWTILKSSPIYYIVISRCLHISFTKTSKFSSYSRILSEEHLEHFTRYYDNFLMYLIHTDLNHISVFTENRRNTAAFI
jgi:hypothetical protein